MTRKRPPNKNRKILIKKCACGCGLDFNSFDERNRLKKFVDQNHWAKYRWGKGFKISLKLRGRRNSTDTEFKSGMIPWNKGLIGADNPLWKENKTTPLRKLIRTHTKYKEWQLAIFEKDNYTCHICKVRGGKLSADHYPLTFHEIIIKENIVSLEEALINKLLWSLSNGRTLCISCHRQTPTWGRLKGG